MQVHKDSIHESGNKLIPDDKAKLEPSARSQEEKIRSIMRCRPSDTFTAQEMAGLMLTSRGNAARALSNLSGSIDRYVDDYGNYPVIKREDIRRRDEPGGPRNCTYQWNQYYGRRPAPVDSHGQLSLMESTQGWAV